LSWLLSLRLTSRRDRVLVTCAGLAPDVDGLTLLAGADLYAEYHHVLTHGVVAATVVALACLAVANAKLTTAALGLAAFHLHLVCDLAGSGPGWPIHYFWPISMREWFWDGQWDLASWQNSLIGLTVTLTGLAMALVVRRTPVELLSVRWDQRVTQTLRTRFLRERTKV
jgi:inner membrane protein